MKIIDAGHRYLLDILDGNSVDHGIISLTFVKREGKKFPFNKGSYPGTNCQEVLRVLIDRSKYLYRQQPCAETQSIIGCLETALLLFELRAARCHDRHIKLDTVDRLVSGPVCKICGHFDCNDDHKLKET